MSLARLIGRGNNRFVRNVALLSCGSALAQLLPALFSPVLARLYDTTDFGVYALFAAAVNLTGQLACLKYDMAITVVKDDDEALRLLYVCLMSSAGIACAFMLLLPFAGWLGAALGIAESGWIYLIPFTTFVVGIYTSLTAYHIRCENYAVISRSILLKSMGMLSVQLLLPKAGMGGFVLSAGHLTAYIAGSFYLLIPLLKTIQARNPILCEILQTVKRNKGYPRFIAGGSLAISMVYNLNSYALSILYTTTQLGYYSLISRVLGAPLMLLGNSVGQVYLRRASACRKAAVRRHEFILVSLTLAVSALPIFVCLAWFARPMITVVFGTEWIPAAAMLRAMAPLYYIRLVVTPVMTAAIIQKKHRATMRWQLCMLAVSLLTALLAGIARWSIGTYVWSLSLALSAGYTVFYLFCLRTLQQAERRETVD